MSDVRYKIRSLAPKAPLAMRSPDARAFAKRHGWAHAPRHHCAVFAVTQPTPSHLRLHIEEAPVAPPPVAPPSLLDEVCEAFSRATGLQLSVSPVDQTAPPRDLLWSTLIADGGELLGDVAHA